MKVSHLNLSLMRIMRTSVQTTTLVLLISSCQAQEPEMVGGITGKAYNYSQESFAFVKINGKTVSTALRKAKIGGVQGGGGMCCIALPLGVKTVDVTLDPSKGEAVTVKAPVEKWWPDMANSAVVHILPGRKVVVEIKTAYTWPRRDLMEARIKELGLKKEEEYDGIYTDGPNERTDGVK